MSFITPSLVGAKPYRLIGLVGVLAAVGSCQSDHPSLNTAPYGARPAGSVASVTPWLVEDYSTYSSTADYMAAGIYNRGEDGDFASNGVIDNTVGLNVGGFALTQSLRYDFPDRTSDTAKYCHDYSVGRNINLPTDVPEIWVEVWVRFPSTFTTVAPGCDGISNPDYKMLLVRFLTSSRANLTPGTYGNSWTWGIGSDQQGDGGNPPHTIPGLPWDDTWHQYRIHLMHDRSGSVGHYTAGDWWMDGVLMKSFPDVNDPTAIYGNLWGLAIGRNLNQGPDHPMSYWWGRIAVYNTDPGWGTP